MFKKNSKKNKRKREQMDVPLKWEFAMQLLSLLHSGNHKAREKENAEFLNHCRLETVNKFSSVGYWKSK